MLAVLGIFCRARDESGETLSTRAFQKFENFDFYLTVGIECLFCLLKVVQRNHDHRNLESVFRKSVWKARGKSLETLEMFEKFAPVVPEDSTI